MSQAFTSFTSHEDPEARMSRGLGALRALRDIAMNTRSGPGDTIDALNRDDLVELLNLIGLELESALKGFLDERDRRRAA